MATLTNTKIKDTYDGLLKTTDNEALDVSGVTLIEDGLGNASALSVGRSGNGVTITGSLNATLATAAQPNITSVGTLSSLSVSGNLAVDTNTLYVDAASNEVGIGTSSPSVKFEVLQSSASDGTGAVKINKSGNGSGNALEISNSGSSRSLDINHNADGTGTVDDIVRISNNGSRKFTIDSSGNVKISGIKLNPTGAGGELLFGSDVTTYAGIKTTSPAAQDIDLTFHTTTNAGIDGSPERMRIDSSGRVGINTNSLSSMLNVAGDSTTPAVRVFNGGLSSPITSFSAVAALQLISYQSVGGSPYTKTSALIANADSTVPSEMQFWTKSNGSSSPTERMRITSGGDVLIGTQTNLGSASNGYEVVAGKHKTVSGELSGAVSGTAYTMFTAPNSLSAWLVTINVSAGTTSYAETALINVNATAVTATTLFNGGNVAITVSGQNVQGTQSSGANQNIQWSAIRIA